MAKKALILGAGGVSNVVAHKCAQLAPLFSEVVIASRTLEKCAAICARLGERISAKPVRVDGDDIGELTRLLIDERPDILINVALPEQNLSAMAACLEAKVHYLDTSAPEPEFGKYEIFSYSWQLDFHRRYREKGLTALLSLGFDPGVTNIFCAYAHQHLFDQLEAIEILDCNGGDHGRPFATNFNPVTNIMEILQEGMYWERGQWKNFPAFSKKRIYNFQELGPQPMYAIYHEELETLVERLPGLQRLRFWMGFSDAYLQHLFAFRNVGLTSMEAISYGGIEIRPLEFLAALLPDPAGLGEGYTGKTNIGCLCSGIKDGKDHEAYIYNISDHAVAYREVKSQAISYTTGIPAALGAALLLDGTWSRPGVYVPEDLDPVPFLERLPALGLPWSVDHQPSAMSDLS